MAVKPKLIIFGAGGHGHVVADIATEVGYSEIVFVDEIYPVSGAQSGWPIVAASVTKDMKSSHIVVAIGNNINRMKHVKCLISDGFTLPILIHPTAYVSPQAILGAGCVVMPQAAVNARAVTGIAVIINTGSTVDHDCNIADGVHICPGAHIAGNVKIGTGSQIGIGSAVRERITIGNNVIVAAGAAVVTDASDNVLMAGVPAKPRDR